MEATIRRETETPLHNLGATTRRGEGFARAGQAGNGAELRAKVRAALEKAKAMCQRLQEQTVTKAKAADQTVRTHPYQAIGVAFGVGLLIGLVTMRIRRN